MGNTGAQNYVISTTLYKLKARYVCLCIRIVSCIYRASHPHHPELQISSKVATHTHTHTHTHTKCAADTGQAEATR